MNQDQKNFTTVPALEPFGGAAVLLAFFDTAPAFFVVKHPDGRYLYVNQFVAAWQKRADLVGKTMNDLAPPHIADAARKKEIEVLTTGNMMQTREVFPASEGRLVSATVMRFPIDTPSQRLLAVIGLDVTELARAQQRHEALLELATDAIHVRDLSGRIIYWNRAAERLYGWTAAEVQGRNALEILFPKDAESAQALALIHEQLLHHESWSGELRKITRQGGALVVQSRWTLLHDDMGEPDALLVIDTDVTQRKQIEEQLHRAVRIDTVGSLAGGVAHDLNNMLMPILMGAAVIRKRVSEPDLARTADHLEQSAKKAAALVRQILTFIRGSQDAKESIAGDVLLAELQHFLTATFPASLRIEYRADEQLPPIVCRASEIHQVLVNLCVNARDAMDDDGTLLIEARNAVIDAAYARMSPRPIKPGKYVSFSVTDYGKGIPRDQLATIFDRYFTTKEQGKGTGLGLSNAAAIVHDHGGFMKVDSEQGKKTIFTVFLPAAETAPARPEIADDVPLGAGETILVVDDEGAVLQVVRETLEAFNYKVITALDGSEAIALLTRHSDVVRVVITDLSMPIVDGIALAKFARRAHPELKVIITSGTDDPLRREAADHADAHLHKPYTADMLLRVVAKLLKQAGESPYPL
jgi:PAS domain S-box-containing protein